MPDCPPTPRTEAELGFVRKPMVGWFNPAQLVRTRTKALLSGIFGAYADKREIQAVLQQARIHDYAREEEIWIDYIADLGDGWNSTYAMAWLLAQPKLTLEHGNRRIDTPRGRILVMGGDQVYQTAKREEYQDRMVGPYRSALPCVPQGSPPHLFAIPGNHDWYDGLTAFIRLFCQGRWIGGWRTQQSRSYFAIQLPHNWWLWGVDIQLESDIDKPQLDYFENIAKHKMQEGNRVILATAVPSWVYAMPQKMDEQEAKQEIRPQDNLSFLEEKIIRKYGGTLSMTVAGDLHHYCHYQDKSGKHHKITSGGGGAFLHGTHTLPDTLELNEGGVKVSYSKTATYPGVVRSRMLTFGNLLFPFKNWNFALSIAGLYLLYAWILQSASKKYDKTLMEKIYNLPYSDWLLVLKELYVVLAHSPASVVFLLVLLGGLAAFCDPKPEKPQWLRTLKRIILGTMHGLLHLGLNISLIWWFAHLNLTLLGMGVDDPLQVLSFSGEMFLLGGLAGGFTMGAYLFLTNNLLGFHRDAAFSSLRIEHYKNFLRLHINKTGLAVYPVGVRKVPRRWRFMPKAKMGEAWFEPTKDSIKTHLIEEPIRVNEPKQLTQP